MSALESEANARLIAAAPRMHSGITGLLADLDANREQKALGAIIMKWAPALRAILRDVEGESNG